MNDQKNNADIKVGSNIEIDAVLDKIKKCMALSKSSNANEAAVALKQAIKLAEMHNISMDQIKYSDIQSFRFSRNTKKITSHEELLVSLILINFNCECFLVTTGSNYQYEFIGIGNKPEIAAYVFKSLMSKLKIKRTNFLKDIDCKTKTEKTYLGDVFSFGWVSQIENKIECYANPEEKKIVSGFIAMKQTETKKSNFRRKELEFINKKEVSHQEFNAFMEGQTQARDEQIHHGLNGESNELMGLENAY